MGNVVSSNKVPHEECVNVADLPLISREDARARGLLQVRGLACDVQHFGANEHPGGPAVLEKLVRAGLDATLDFEEVHHSEDASRIMQKLAIARLADSHDQDSKDNSTELLDARLQRRSSRQEHPCASNSLEAVPLSDLNVQSNQANKGASNEERIQPNDVGAVDHIDANSINQDQSLPDEQELEAGSSVFSKSNDSLSKPTGRGEILIFFGSQTGTSKMLAERLALIEPISQWGDVRSMADFDPEDLSSESCVICIMATSSGGLPPPAGRFFSKWLEDAPQDFRVDKSWLSSVEFGVFAVGDSQYEEQFNLAGKSLWRSFLQLGASSLVTMGSGDVQGDIVLHFDLWTRELMAVLESEVKEEERMQYDFLGDDDASTEVVQPPIETLADVEELGTLMDSASKDQADVVAPPMVTPIIRASLTKQGYKVLGSHSGVKLCRWTKAQLRGRGGCYKHTFYGITSYQCMEMTPSLACANKCIFCWRHHTNPVGRRWKWAMDPPDQIVEQAIDQHRKMLKPLKGAVGVQPDRYAEAFNIRHCALSLVGEPIMYPEINALLGQLHDRRISSFLVTNAQFPERIAQLVPVTQLYISVDAPTESELKRVDRPLFKDFWERYLASMDALREYAQRTVFRVTLVKGYNTDHVNEYARLVRRARPDLIEIKGVTYCGSSDASPLTMGNVPYHREVVEFARQLVAALLTENSSNDGGNEYDLACEHEHSCCVLVARTSFCIQGKWHTWINYDRFHELNASGQPFSALDYMAPTPDWATFGDSHHGFDPEETRFFRKKRAVVMDEA